MTPAFAFATGFANACHLGGSITPIDTRHAVFGRLTEVAMKAARTYAGTKKSMEGVPQYAAAVVAKHAYEKEPEFQRFAPRTAEDKTLDLKVWVSACTSMIEAAKAEKARTAS